MNISSGLEGWLRLTLTPGLRGARLRSLLQQFGLPEHVLRERRAHIAAIVGAEIAAALDSDAVSTQTARALNWAAGEGNCILTLADESYPALLLEMQDPPAVLYCQGNATLLARPALAIVGSRNATAQGVRDAGAFAESLGNAGLTIVSGLALGIDAAAHLAGLRTQASTIAVLGAGVDIAYPSANARLHAEIAAGGLLVSEFPLATPPAARNFPRRNRIISGLSLGCLVIEAAPASGSLITARLAAEYGREVFAVPGSIHAPLSRGSHSLIKAGAKLVETSEDVLAELGQHVLPTRSRSAPDHGLLQPPVDNGILKHMDHAPIDVDSIARRSGLPVTDVAAILLKLELAGQVAAVAGGLYQRIT
jgi:DNA processing protein